MPRSVRNGKVVTGRSLALLLSCASLCILTGPLYAADLEADPSNYRAALARLRPGETLVLKAGTYMHGLPLRDVHGSATRPIIVRGAPDQSSLFLAQGCCNTVELENVSYVEIRNLTLEGGNLDGPFAVNARGTSHNVTLEGLRIVGHGANQAVVGISTKGPAWNWVIRGNAIIGAGTGMYLGSSDGTAPFVAGVIENNLFLDTLGYNVQIKHQLPRATDIGLPVTASSTIIRHNVFSKQNSAARGRNARPNLLVGHFPLSGYGVEDTYEIYGNLFYENPSEALFQGEGNIALHDNVFVTTTGAAVNIQPHRATPRRVLVYHNTILAKRSGIRVIGGAAHFPRHIVGNAVFAASPVEGPDARENSIGSYEEAAAAFVAPFAPLGQLDLSPRPDHLIGAPADLSLFQALAAGTLDFDGRTRHGRFRGAFEGPRNPHGWPLGRTFKPSPDLSGQ
jgi:Right handed beta helix region